MSMGDKGYQSFRFTVNKVIPMKSVDLDDHRLELFRDDDMLLESDDVKNIIIVSINMSLLEP